MSRITSLIRSDVPSSTPFMRLTSTASSGSTATHRPRFSRSDCDGTASTTVSAPDAASAASCVAVTPGGSSTPGR